jgi:hypothetical protein
MKTACARAPRLGLLQGRDIRLIDGTSLRLADTPMNQRRFPQPSAQATGCGCPVMKVLALFCLRSGAALNFVTAKQTKHDTPLAQKIWRHLCNGDVLLGDRAFGDFVTLALLPLRGVDVVARLHQARMPDFRNPHKSIGPDDAIFVWNKPMQRPRWKEAMGSDQRQWSQIYPFDNWSRRVVTKACISEGQWGQICPFDKSSSGPKALRIEGSGPWYRVVNLTRFPIFGSSGD